MVDIGGAGGPIGGDAPSIVRPRIEEEMALEGEEERGVGREDGEELIGGRIDEERDARADEGCTDALRLMDGMGSIAIDDREEGKELGTEEEAFG